MFKRILIVLFVLNSVNSEAINNKDSLQSYIVHFSQQSEIESLRELSHYKFESIDALNLQNTYFKFSYYKSKLSQSAVVSLITQLPYYDMHQEDNVVSMRTTTPNDTFFGQQWHLSLIKAVQAWDITRSGVNRRGDTIVVAVVDDGLHINHPDFQGNIWINYADTLGNGVDDDGNGYIEDTYGWNFVGQNNDISDSLYYKAKHGTPVSGIIGARTNNITGVSGIMWNVKLMIVNITDTGRFPTTYQSDVIKAYSYILYQRRLYEQTNGQKGAFVTVVNSSWGIDGKKPNQAPLWCAFYDTMGAAGILNVSAVSNAQE
ncbi:MAG: S8 family serine peptidase, partial [Bacteroidia bacterium]|nr:S8 family serine peptidase [Bacteroidia bacterium]